MNKRMIALLILAVAGICLGAAQLPQHNLGRPATAEEIRKRDISVAPDGTGLPAGHGSVEEGRQVYKILCGSCHGDRGQGFGDYPPLVGGPLTPDETYAVTAFILYMNGIVDQKAELNEKSLSKVKMPNRDGFVLDPRTDVPTKEGKK